MFLVPFVVQFCHTHSYMDAGIQLCCKYENLNTSNSCALENGFSDTEKVFYFISA